MVTPNFLFGYQEHLLSSAFSAVLNRGKNTLALVSTTNRTVRVITILNVPDRHLKVHGRWKSDSAKDGYVCDKVDSRLLVALNIDRIHKWRLSYFCFVFMLIILTSLVNTSKIQKTFFLQSEAR